MVRGQTDSITNQPNFDAVALKVKSFDGVSTLVSFPTAESFSTAIRRKINISQRFNTLVYSIEIS